MFVLVLFARVCLDVSPALVLLESWLLLELLVVLWRLRWPYLTYLTVLPTALLDQLARESGDFWSSLRFKPEPP